jgi:hypothetical protein
MESSEAVTVLTAAARLVQVEPPQVIGALSETLATVVPHRAAAHLSPQCAGSPLSATGDPKVTAVITGAELAPFLGSVSAGRPWQGEAEIGGVVETVLAIASDHAPRGSVLAFVLDPGTRIPEQTLPLVQTLWDVVTAHLNRLTLEIEPSVLAQSRAVAMARDVVAAELTDAHTATLAALLGVLPSTHWPTCAPSPSATAPTPARNQPAGPSSASPTRCTPCCGTCPSSSNWMPPATTA